MTSNSDELSLDEILRHFPGPDRGRYHKALEEFVDGEISISEPQPLPMSREERLTRIIVKRYNVPEEIVQALKDELYDYDW